MIGSITHQENRSWTSTACYAACLPPTPVAPAAPTKNPCARI